MNTQVLSRLSHTNPAVTYQPNSFNLELLRKASPSHPTPPRSSSHLTSVSGKSSESQFSRNRVDHRRRKRSCGMTVQVLSRLSTYRGHQFTIDLVGWLADRAIGMATPGAA